MPSVGTVTSEERKRQIYAVAQEYNLLLIEDDPYYLLQYRAGVLNCFLSAFSRQLGVILHPICSVNVSAFNLVR